MAHSPDRTWWWNGTTWIPAFSPDRTWWWDGARWVPARPPQAVTYRYEPTVWTRRLQWIVLGLLAVGFLVSAVTAPTVITQVMNQMAQQQSAVNRPDMTPQQLAQFQRLMSEMVYGSFIFAGVLTVVLTVLQLMGIWKLWRWVYWYFVVVGLFDIIALVQDALYAAGQGIGSFRPPPFVLVTSVVFGVAWISLAIWMIVLYRRYGTWARRRVAVTPEAASGNLP